MTRREREENRVNLQMERFKPIPSDFDDWVARESITPHLFYNRKKKQCYCSRCRQDVPLINVKHGEVTNCPVCGTRETACSTGYRRKQEICWSVIVEADDGDVLTRYFRSIIKWEDYRNPSIETAELYRSIIDNLGTYLYMWWWRTNDDSPSWMRYRKRGMGYNAYTSEYYEPQLIKCYTDISSIIVGTKFKYSCLDGLLKNCRGMKDGYMEGYAIEGWLNTYRSKPYIELMYKVGFYALVNWCINNYLTTNLKNGRSVCEVLGITRSQFKMLRDIGNPTEQEYKAVKECNASSVDEIVWCAKQAENQYGAFGIINKLKEIIPLRKLKNYAEKRGVKLTDYNDYVGWLVELGYDVKDAYYLYPKDFRSAHDKLMREKLDHDNKIKKERKLLQSELIRKANKEFENIASFRLHSNGLFIRLARNADELSNEGKTLHHCVGTYAQRMAEGKTLILFIRKENAPDDPYYTMEFNDGHVVQLRGLRNCEPTLEVLEFKRKFEETLRKELIAS